MTPYQALQTEAAALADLDAALALFSWDQEVNMPSGAAARRATQMATLAGIRHGRMLEKLVPLAAKAREQKDLSENQLLNLKQLQHALDRLTKLPEAFVQTLTEATSRAQHAWEAAKRDADFAAFLPHLEKIVALKHQEADYYGYARSPYDALLDGYDQGANTQDLDTLFAALKPRLQTIVDAVAKAPQVDDSFLRTPVSKEAQWQFTLRVLRDLGYDFDHGRQDYSTHPFSISFGMEDVRITTKFTETDVQDMLYSTIHECGHALYEQGLPPSGYGMPAGEACSLSIHESQSRIWENNIGRSLAFWEHYFDAFAQLFPDKLKGKTPLHVFQAVNKVAPSLIRISADEVTYHFHIMLRYELEKDLMERRLHPRDLPQAWNAKVKQYLHINVPNDAQGCLQDVHWSHGSLGYFPTYSLGSLYAAQFEAHALRSDAAMAPALKNGNFAPLRQWLAANIYQNGRLYASQELCKRVTGEPLQADYFVRYIQTKLKVVYGAL
jgi:carboxypeptidase Taq